MHALKLRPRAPFDFDATARFLRFTEAELVDKFDAGVYARASHFGDKLLLLTVSSDAARARPSLLVSLAPSRSVTRADLTEAEEKVRQTFSVAHDLRRWRAQVSDDPLMSRLETAHRGLHLPRWATLFEALTNAILLQQIATTVAWTFRRRVVERFGEQLSFGGKKFYAFPRPHALAGATVESLRALGLSGAKAQSIIEMARTIDAGALDTDALARADNEEIIARLSTLRGVGRWTAEWVLMLHFGRTDVCAAADLFLRGAVVKYYNDGAPMTEREIRAFAARRWGAWQSYAALYLLAGMRAGSITLKPERVLLSQPPGARREREPTNQR
ncbi:MAG: DNA-3-methyladenine glycosylase [Acidobacteriota bacterium]|jgi:DNA-3-methyladenine glycosylase II|nr:DNA-3-methyladenine glycosylase [Acidobacteriota bacterium]